MKWPLLLVLLGACRVQAGRDEPSEAPEQKAERARIAAALRKAELEEQERKRVFDEEQAKKQREQQAETDRIARGKTERDDLVRSELAEAQAQCAKEQETERAEAAAASEYDAKALAWARANCTLREFPPKDVVRCEPVCIKETLHRCPEYACRGKPPDPEWPARANALACGEFRGVRPGTARAVTSDACLKAQFGQSERSGPTYFRAVP